ncbi:unnamed protein product [Linum tenue]|uniref:Auxin-responsive protein n=1 Tax=Linum tenue TaxID=586396 RepID=A0AAV0QDS3_9ROSI|nr:unnamed protein product [Linum tenue]
MSVPLEHDYIGDSSMEKTGDVSIITPQQKSTTKFASSLSMNLKATELRLGLPGSESPERDDGSSAELCIGLPSSKSSVSRPKRGFSVAIHGGSGNWVFSPGAGGPDNNFSSPRNNPAAANSEQAPKDGGLPPQSSPATEKKKAQAAGSGAGPASKAQVVGWPPIRSFRKNTMASHPTPKNSDVVEGGDHNPNSGGSASSTSACLYVKVSMDGAPYLRKVDLKTYGGYKDLSLALENMFSCFTIGQCGSHGVAGRDGVSESRLVDILHGSEYVLTYEDKDGDWMLVGDVPWKMFIDSCRRLRIMKSSEAIGLGTNETEAAQGAAVCLNLDGW